MNGDAWDAQAIIGVIKRDEMIQREGEIGRAELTRGVES